VSHPEEVPVQCVSVKPRLLLGNPQSWGFGVILPDESGYTGTHHA